MSAIPVTVSGVLSIGGYMKIYTIFFALTLTSTLAGAGELCFSPVKEKKGDKSTKRSFFQPFDYEVQVDDGLIIKPFAEKSTPYPYSSKSPVVKIWLDDEITESFRIREEWLKSGRNCIYFKNIYETWSVAEVWQTQKLCSCSSN